MTHLKPKAKLALVACLSLSGFYREQRVISYNSCILDNL